MPKEEEEQEVCHLWRYPQVSQVPIKDSTTSPEAVTMGVGEGTDGERMTLHEHITLLDCIKYSPTHCTKCGHQNPEHLEMECPMYKQCLRCFQWGVRGFVRCHLCSTISNVSWGANTDYYKEEWYQGHD